MSLKNELQKITEQAKAHMEKELKRQKEQENTKCSRLINQFKNELHGKAQENLDNRTGLLKNALNGHNRYRLYHAEKNEKLYEDITKCKIMKKFAEENEEKYSLGLRYGEFYNIKSNTSMCEIFYSWYL